MKQPVYEQLMTAVEGSIEGIPGLTGKVYRCRETPFSRAEVPAANLKPDEEVTESFSQWIDKNTFQINVHLYVRSNKWDSEVSLFDTQVDSAIINSPQVTSLCTIRRMGVRFNGDDADMSAGELVIRYQAIYLCLKRDRTVSA